MRTTGRIQSIFLSLGMYQARTAALCPDDLTLYVKSSAQCFDAYKQHTVIPQCWTERFITGQLSHRSVNASQLGSLSRRCTLENR